MYTIEEITEAFKEDFTVDEFAKYFNYKSFAGAKNAIKDLILRGQVEQHRIKGLYKVKKNPLLT
jgi:hypothetical protein